MGIHRLAAKANKTKDYMGYLESYRPRNRLMIVRNPWARLVSAYTDKLVRSKWRLGVCQDNADYATICFVIFFRYSEILPCCVASSSPAVSFIGQLFIKAITQEVQYIDAD